MADARQSPEVHGALASKFILSRNSTGKRPLTGGSAARHNSKYHQQVMTSALNSDTATNCNFFLTPPCLQCPGLNNIPLLS